LGRGVGDVGGGGAAANRASTLLKRSLKEKQRKSPLKGIGKQD